MTFYKIKDLLRAKNVSWPDQFIEDFVSYMGYNNHRKGVNYNLKGDIWYQLQGFHKRWNKLQQLREQHAELMSTDDFFMTMYRHGIMPAPLYDLLISSNTVYKSDLEENYQLLFKVQSLGDKSYVISIYNFQYDFEIKLPDKPYNTINVKGDKLENTLKYVSVTDRSLYDGTLLPADKRAALSQARRDKQLHSIDCLIESLIEALPAKYAPYLATSLIGHNLNANLNMTLDKASLISHGQDDEKLWKELTENWQANIGEENLTLSYNQDIASFIVPAIAKALGRQSCYHFFSQVRHYYHSAIGAPHSIDKNYLWQNWLNETKGESISQYAPEMPVLDDLHEHVKNKKLHYFDWIAEHAKKWYKSVYPNAQDYDYNELVKYYLRSWILYYTRHYTNNLFSNFDFYAKDGDATRLWANVPDFNWQAKHYDRVIPVDFTEMGSEALDYRGQRLLALASSGNYISDEKLYKHLMATLFSPWQISRWQFDYQSISKIFNQSFTNYISPTMFDYIKGNIEMFTFRPHDNMAQPRVCVKVEWPVFKSKHVEYLFSPDKAIYNQSSYSRIAYDDQWKDAFSPQQGWQQLAAHILHNYIARNYWAIYYVLEQMYDFDIYYKINEILMSNNYDFANHEHLSHALSQVLNISIETDNLTLTIIAWYLQRWGTISDYMQGQNNMKTFLQNRYGNTWKADFHKSFLEDILDKFAPGQSHMLPDTLRLRQEIVKDIAKVENNEPLKHALIANLAAIQKPVFNVVNNKQQGSSLFTKSSLKKYHDELVELLNNVSAFVLALSQDNIFLYPNTIEQANKNLTKEQFQAWQQAKVDIYKRGLNGEQASDLLLAALDNGTKYHWNYPSPTIELIANSVDDIEGLELITTLPRLAREGQLQSHCVKSYDQLIREGKSIILTYSHPDLTEDNKPVRVTIELRPTQRGLVIVQMRSRFNKDYLGDVQVQVIYDWVAKLNVILANDKMKYTTN